MRVDTDTYASVGLPVFLGQANRLLAGLRDLDYDSLKKLWACSDKIARENYARLQEMNLTRQLTPAILSYDGIQYQYMAPSVFEERELGYIQEHLRILSGFYGVLKPMDGVVPYRLEMQAKVSLLGFRSLYDFWGDIIYREVMDESRTIVNLASKEYARSNEPYLRDGDIFLTCVFGEMQGGKVVQKGVYAKMARGEMVRFMAGRNITDLSEIKGFNRLGYRFFQELSSEREYVFIMEKDCQNRAG